LHFDIGRSGRRSLALAAGLVFVLPSLTDAQAVPAFSGRYRFMLTVSPSCPPNSLGPLSIVVNLSERAISAGSEVSGQSASPTEDPNNGRLELQRVGNRLHGPFGASTAELGLNTEGPNRVWMEIISDGTASVSSGGRARATGTAFGEVEVSLASDPTGKPTLECGFMTTGFQWSLEPA
jgi:hypothetical protein